MFKNSFIESIKKGKLFIYPTDTIYGIGCNATNSKSVRKIRLIKKRDKKPFSVIAPNKEWITKNFYVNKKWLKKLPGRYTLILKEKRKVVCEEVNSGLSTLGVRIPKHSFSKLIEKANVPFVTTSVNFSGQPAARSVKEIPKEILKKVDYIIDEGILNNKPSTIIDLTKKRAEIIKR